MSFSSSSSSSSSSSFGVAFRKTTHRHASSSSRPPPSEKSRKSHFSWRRRRGSRNTCRKGTLGGVDFDAVDDDDDDDDCVVVSDERLIRSQNATTTKPTTTTTSRLECRGRRGETEEDDHDKGTNGFFFGEFVTEIVDETKKKASASASSSSAFHNSGGFLYVRNFFDPEDFKIIERACDDLRKHLKEEKRVCANSRLGVMVPEEDVVHQMCCSEFAAEKLRELVLSGEDKKDEKKRYALKPSDVPVEYRIYPSGGSMDWHRDVALYTEPQFEIVCTIHNSSDSRTEWKDIKTGRRRAIRSEPNSVLIVQADSVVHRVTPITKGERSIVKFAYSTTNEKTLDYYDNLLTYNDDYEPEEGSNGKRASSSSSSSSSSSDNSCSENFPSPH